MPRKLKLQVDSLRLLLGLNISLFILPTLLVMFLLSNNSNAYGFFLDLLGGLIPGKFLNGEFWRVITSTFLHADILHVAANMFSLYFVGAIIQRYYGRKWLFSFYILAGLGGSIVSVIFLSSTPTVGASGAVFGLIGVLLGGSLRRRRFGAELPFRFMDVAPLALYAFFVGLIPGFPVNNWAHLGGLLVGVVLGAVVPHNLGKHSRLEQMLEKLAFFAAVAILVLAYVGLGVYLYRVLLG